MYTLTIKKKTLGALSSRGVKMPLRAILFVSLFWERLPKILYGSKFQNFS